MNHAAIGANIGLGILAMVFFAALVLGLFIFGVVNSGVRRYIFFVLSAAILIFAILNWNAREHESNRIYCEEIIADGGIATEGESFCDAFTD